MLAVLVGGCTSADHDAVPVTVTLKRETPSVAKATIVVDYSRAGASIVKDEGRPSCAFILPGVSGEFADDGRGALTIHVQARRGLRGPADLVACRMLAAKADTDPKDIAARLDVKLTEAEDGGGKVLDLSAASPTAVAGGGGEKGSEKAQADAKRSADAAGGKHHGGAAAAPGASGATGAPVAVPVPQNVPAPAAVAPPAPVAAPQAAPAPPPPSRNAAASVPGQGAVLAPSSASQNAGNAAQNPTAGTGTGTSKDPGYDDSPSDQPNAPQYEVTISVSHSAARNLGALQFEVTHTGSAGGWVGHDGNVQCETLVDALTASNWPGGRTVKLGLVSIQGIATPGPVASCQFKSAEYTSAGSFVVTPVDASDTESVPVEPLPTMVVSSVIRR